MLERVVHVTIRQVPPTNGRSRWQSLVATLSQLFLKHVEPLHQRPSNGSNRRHLLSNASHENTSELIRSFRQVHHTGIIEHDRWNMCSLQYHSLLIDPCGGEVHCFWHQTDQHNSAVVLVAHLLEPLVLELVAHWMRSEEMNVASSSLMSLVLQVNSRFQAFPKNSTPRLLRCDMEQSRDPLHETRSDPHVVARLLQELLVLIRDSAASSKSQRTDISSKCCLSGNSCPFFFDRHFSNAHSHQQ